MSITTYHNFDLFMDSGPKGHQVHVTSSLADKPSGEFVLPFTQEELAAFYWHEIGDSRHFGVAETQTEPQMDVASFGRRLYDALFAGQIGLCLRRSLDEAQDLKTGLRVRLRIDSDLTELADLPWEYLHGPPGIGYLALNPATPILRDLAVTHKVGPLSEALPLTVLVVGANPADTLKLKVDEELGRLRKALSSLQSNIRLEHLPKPATLEALHNRLIDRSKPPVHILHFVGHGYFDRSNNEGGLVFEDDEGRSRRVTAEKLRTLLSGRRLRLVFLNACEGAQNGRSDSFAGVAQQLVQGDVPAVVAMQFPISDNAAITLCQWFYQSIANGNPVDTALTEARIAVSTQGNAREWGTPVLFMRAEDGDLFGLGRNKQMAEQSSGQTALPGSRLYPVSKADLQRTEVTISAGDDLDELIFVPGALTVGPGASLRQAVYVRRNALIGAKCHLYSHLIGSGDISIEAGVTIDGDVLVEGQNLTLGEGSVIQGAMLALGDARIAANCTVRQIFGRNVTLGKGSQAGEVVATGDLTLQDGVVIDRCQIGGRLILAGTGGAEVEFRGMDSLTAKGLDWRYQARLKMRSGSPGKANVFVREGTELTPLSTQETVSDKAVLITTLLDHNLAQQIRSFVPLRLSE